MFQGTRESQEGETLWARLMVSKSQESKWKVPNLKKKTKTLLTNSQTYGIISTEIKGCDLTARKETKTMKTMNEFLTSVANGTLTDEAIEFAKNELTKRASANANAAQKRNEKWVEKNGELLTAVANYLRSVGRPVVSAEIVNAVDGIENASKARAIALRIEGIKVGETVFDKRVVKTYSL